MKDGIPCGMQFNFGSLIVSSAVLNFAAAQGWRGGSPSRYILGWYLRIRQTPDKSWADVPLWPLSFPTAQLFERV